MTVILFNLLSKVLKLSIDYINALVFNFITIKLANIILSYRL